MENEKALCPFEQCMLVISEHLKECIATANGFLPQDKQFKLDYCSSGPSDFADFMFSSGDKVFAGILDVVKLEGKGFTFGSADTIDDFVDACKEKGFIPCVFPFMNRGKEIVPFAGMVFVDGVAWNLFNPKTKKAIVPHHEVTK